MSSKQNDGGPNCQDAKDKMRSEFDELHAEMEVAKHGINHFGRSRRKLHRREMKERTMKRKSLEKKDEKASAVHTTKRKRLRGSRAALEDDVVEGSLIFGIGSNNPKNDEDDVSDDADNMDLGQAAEQQDNSQDSDDDEGDEADRYNLYADELNIDIDESDSEEEETSLSKSKSKQSSKRSVQPKYSSYKIAKKMYKMKNFKSHRMAQRHGEALGAHARGLNVSAVDRLKEVATAAPIAPQLYSSLGLVYESKLREETIKASRSNNVSTEGMNEGESEFETLESINRQKNIEDDYESIQERLKLAKKAFASYHVAALLCKMDCSLWIRAGDAALIIANLHAQCLRLPPTIDLDNETVKVDEVEANEENGDEKEEMPNIRSAEDYTRYHVEQRKKWLEEAKEDFQTADNLRPPGISVPSKLAYTHMELGNISEALTILTDLKNKSQEESSKSQERTELERSYYVWLLYAELMLIIGHECRQWNRGIHTNDNYMFRRWLRKYSTSFDWQERRFQALCMALEAAAGTKSCEKLASWIQKRARDMLKDNKDSDEDSRWQVCDTFEMDRKIQLRKEASSNKGDESSSIDESNSKQKSGEDDCIAEKSAMNETSEENNESLTLETLVDKFHNDRISLIDAHGKELLSFDEETENMRLNNNDRLDLKERQEEKLRLIQVQKKALLDLALEYQSQKATLQKKIDMNQQEIDDKRENIALTATCAAVCDIASQLLKQALLMKLYRAGSLACESVSFYLKERAKRIEERKRRWQRFEERQHFREKSILQLEKETYDTYDSDGCGDDSDAILSDDEDFEGPEGTGLLDMMKKGILPPELQVLYGLTLLSERKADFLAVKMLKALEGLETPLNENMHEDLNEKDGDLSLRIFRKAMSEPMTELEAYAFSADIFKNVKIRSTWVDEVLPIFQNYFEKLQKENELNLLKESTSLVNNVNLSLKKENCIKVLFSTFRMRIERAYRSCQSKHIDDAKLVYDSAFSVINDMLKFKKELWKLAPDGNPRTSSIEMLNILSSSFSLAILSMKASENDNISSLRDLLDKMKLCVGLVCNLDFHDLYNSSKGLLSETWRHFPVPSDWQDDEHVVISRSAYNLCVAGAVSSFSGWEKDEFHLNLMKRNRQKVMFGINIQGDKVAGLMDHESEKQLTKIWLLIEDVIPSLTPIDFEDSMKNTKKTGWYKDALKSVHEFEGEQISSFGEDSGLNILLSFANVSLLLASKEEDEIKQNALLKYALSIVLPASQFCLDQSLWDSPLGVKGSGDDTDWHIFSASNASKESAENDSQTRKAQDTKRQSFGKPRQPTLKKISSNRMTKSPMSKLVKSSAEVLLREWNGKETFEGSDEDDDKLEQRLNKWNSNVSGPAKLAMKKLDYSIQKLRQCATIYALSKASLEVALSLLEVASKKECRNPFLCMNQAAIFAAHAPKGGNNDEVFKKSLPTEEDCTADEALQILGRADCLRAIHFTSEAMFLCSFVARVCCLHRDKKEVNHDWTPKWRIVGILTYTVSVGIDSIICSIMYGDERTNTLNSWDKSVKAEIGRGRSDAIAMQKAAGRYNSSMGKTENSFEMDDEEMEGSEDNDNNSDEDDEEMEEDVGDDYEAGASFMNMKLPPLQNGADVNLPMTSLAEDDNDTMTMTETDMSKIQAFEI